MSEKKAAERRTSPAAHRITQEEQDSSIDKKRATLIAQLALRGYAAHALADGGWLVAKGMTRYCPDLAELERLARDVGAAS